MSTGLDEPGLTFGRWRLLPRQRRLLRDGEPVALGSRAFDLLLTLIGVGGELVSKDELMRRVWPGAVVEENNLQVQLSALRKALGDDAARLIVTVPGRGYRFTGTVDATEAAAPCGAPTVEGPAVVRPALVVLPFRNLSGSPEQEYFADGLVEDITTALSHLRWFAVIAPNSAFTFKGRSVGVREVGRELGVRYVLEGSVRRYGGRVRVAVHLSEAEAELEVWGEHFDCDLGDIFDLQDRITEDVVGAIDPILRQAEFERVRARPTESLNAYDLYLRALPHRRFDTQEGNKEALCLLRRAVALDPDYTSAKAALAGLTVIRFAQRWSADGDVEEAVRCARDVLTEGGAVDPGGLAWAGFALSRLAGDYEAGAAAAERALLLAPNSAIALFYGGWSSFYAGDWQRTIERIRRVMRLNPVDPLVFHFNGTLAAACFAGERYDESAEFGRIAIRERPTYIAAHLGLVAALAQLDRRDEIREALRALLAVAPDETVTKVAMRSALRGSVRERYLDALRRAGLPD